MAGRAPIRWVRCGASSPCRGLKPRTCALFSNFPNLARSEHVVSARRARKERGACDKGRPCLWDRLPDNGERLSRSDRRATAGGVEILRRRDGERGASAVVERTKTAVPHHQPSRSRAAVRCHVRRKCDGGGGGCECGTAHCGAGTASVVARGQER
jgi:hypothetical protein